MFFPASLIPVGHVLVQVNNPAALTCNQSCAGDVKWMLSRRPDLPVSECRKGVCVEGNGFKNRTEPVQGEPFLHLKPVMYNDQGWYICYCNNLELCRFHLEVVSPRLESASAGANVTLLCYADTKKNIRDHEIFIEWEKDGQRVVMLKDGDMAYGSGFKGRALVSLSQYKNGDLSLTLLQVQQSDGGLYRCTHRDKELGEPEAINLSIIEPPVWAAVKQSTFPWYESLLVVIFVVLVVFLVFKFHKHISRQGNCTMWPRLYNNVKGPSA